MKYDFDKETHRRGTNSYKWDSCDDGDVMPLWVADMDFEVAQPIRDALAERVRHGIFGYTKVPEGYYEAIINWFERRHHWTIEREWIQYTTGVVPALSATVRALTVPGDRVIITTPVYGLFFSSIRNNKCEIVESRLAMNSEGKFVFDYDDIARKAADERTKALILCNPHNPGGRVWTAEELERLNFICEANGVRIIADEIHCELTMPGFEYTPMMSLSQNCRENTIALNSPSKAFNIAGLQIANIVCTSGELRQRIDRAINDMEVCDVNTFAPIALMAAYNESEDWLDQLLAYIKGNYEAVLEVFEPRGSKHETENRETATQNSKLLKLMPVEGTYLAWVDCRATGLTSAELDELLRREARVMISPGTSFGEAGDGFIRINMACQRQRLVEGCRAIVETLRKKLK